MRRTATHHSPPTIHHSAFTLVEMLVAVALVLLLMTLFAQVFQMAGGSVSTQRGIMENDQKARSAQTLIIGDLRKRTFRRVIPFAFNENVSAIEADLAHRKGYFYISENDPFNDTDDVLALTVDARITTETKDILKFYGRALALAPAAFTPAQQTIYFYTNLNQPEVDDGRTDLNGTSAASTAEIVYFLRNGNLYRRVLLVREPDPPEDQDDPMDDSGNRFFARDYQFPSGSGNFFVYPNGGNGGGFAGATTFWKDFEFSAHPTLTLNLAGPAFFYNGAQFNGVNSLLISLPADAFTSAADFSPGSVEIAYPANRFGLNTVNPSPLLGGGPNIWLSPIGGQPREYGDTGWWVGRMTAEETSYRPSVGGNHPNAPFIYPQLVHQIPNSAADSSNYMSVAAPWTDVIDSFGNAVSDNVIDIFEDPTAGVAGTYRGEDLLLSNVHSFDIKVWDDVLNQFVDVGHSLTNAAGVLGDFHSSRQLNTVYGPNVGANRMFDTWYPFSHRDANGNGTFDAAEVTDTDGDGILDSAENTSGVNSRQTLDFNADGTIARSDVNGDGIIDVGENFPPFRPLHATPLPGNSGAAGTIDLLGPHFERYVPSTAANAPSRYQTGHRVFPSALSNATQWGDPFYYLCVDMRDLNNDGTISQAYSASGQEPFSWPHVDGLNVIDGEITWQAVENRKPLRAIQITLRFLDPTTQQMRTLTIQHSLID